MRSHSPLNSASHSSWQWAEIRSTVTSALFISHFLFLGGVMLTGQAAFSNNSNHLRLRKQSANHCVIILIKWQMHIYSQLDINSARSAVIIWFEREREKLPRCKIENPLCVCCRSGNAKWLICLLLPQGAHSVCGAPSWESFPAESAHFAFGRDNSEFCGVWSNIMSKLFAWVTNWMCVWFLYSFLT